MLFTPKFSLPYAHQPNASSDFHIDLDSGSSNVLVSRNIDDVLVSELMAADFAWLEEIQAGSPLGDATFATQEPIRNLTFKPPY